MKPTLLILAAGMGSRYGSLKQMDGLGPNGEAIIDYSIFDAIRAGFGKVVFVIRHSFADTFKEHFRAEKFSDDVKFEFVYQELDNLPEGYTVPEGRQKPWGTNHAVMMAAGVINEPFAVINSDDFYGRSSYETMAAYLRSIEGTEGQYAMVGYYLENTLSEFGTVSRGICGVDKDNKLTTVTERTAIARSGGMVYYIENDEKHELNPHSYVSMNFWGFTPDYFKHSERIFRQFLDENRDNLKAEYFIPYIADKLIVDNIASVKVLECDAKWFGVTYKEDRPFTVEKINALIAAGEYPEKIWKA
ncbi:MAG: nucleotidyltransferase [Bacteroidales bacterium]|nr:nucleotidyltransferase [Bacteroidales bacterium]